MKLSSVLSPNWKKRRCLKFVVDIMASEIESWKDQFSSSVLDDDDVVRLFQTSRKACDMQDIDRFLISNRCSIDALGWSLFDVVKDLVFIYTKNVSGISMVAKAFRTIDEVFKDYLEQLISYFDGPKVAGDFVRGMVLACSKS